MWRLRLAERFGADIILPELLVNLASCDPRRDFTRPMHARFTDLTAQSRGIQGLAGVARVPQGINLLQLCFRTLTPAVCGAQGETTLRTSMSPARGSEPPVASRTWPEKAEDWQA
jgi:hypothetical protein